MRKWKKWIVSKNCLTLVVSRREKNAHFHAHYLFWPKLVLGLKTHFYWRRCFWHGWKSVFYCVFEKLCSSENAIFIVLSAKHSTCNKKDVCEKTELMKNSGLFLNMAIFFLVLRFWWFVFCVVGKVAKVLKMLVFPNCFGGGLFSFFGFGRFRCFRVSCFCFYFVYVLFLFVLLSFCFVVGLFSVLFSF